MKDYQMAWRNLWRNKRRTLITATSVFFAVFFALVMRSFQLGTYDKLYKDVIESYTGYLQLQQADYFEEPNLDNSFTVDTALFNEMESDPNVTAVIPRLQSFALAASGSRTQGVKVIGMDPEGEDKALNIRNRMVRYKLTPEAIEAIKAENMPARTEKLLDVFVNESYTDLSHLLNDLGIDKSDTSLLLPVITKFASFENGYLSSDDSGSVIIGNGLSEYLKAGVGDTVILMGQGYHGTSAAGTFTVRGIVKLPAPDIDNILVYMPINAARELYAAPDMASSAIINIKDKDEEAVTQTGKRLRRMTGDNLAIRSWQEMNALLLNQMEADNRSGAIMIAILYLVIAFGVFGTVLMMLAERRREFGMLVSIGMQKGKLAKVVAMEMLLIGLLGLASGVVASLPLVLYGNVHPLRFTGEMAKMYEDYGFEPVMPTLLPDTYYLWQVVVVLIILSISIAFSVRKIFKMNVINALRA
jgi:ABC-type lipoprotein release transport system permease subunit